MIVGNTDALKKIRISSFILNEPDLFTICSFMAIFFLMGTLLIAGPVIEFIANDHMHHCMWRVSITSLGCNGGTEGQRYS